MSAQPIPQQVDNSSAAANEDLVVGSQARINFYGVPITLGSGGSLVPDKNQFKDDVITFFDKKLMRDIAIALDLNHPLLIEGGADLGKTQAVDRVCAYTNREVYFVNCRDIEAEMLIGRLTAVENSKSGFGWKDGIVMQAIRNGGVLVLDEYNRLKGEARAVFHQVYDAVLRGKGQVVLAENNGEVVPLHPNFRIVMTQNPPDGTYTNREVIDPAEISRVVHLRYPAQLPAEVEEARILGSFGIVSQAQDAQAQDSLPYQPKLDKTVLAKIPGMAEVLIKFVEFHRHLRHAIANRELAADSAQPVHLTFQRDVKRLFTFVSSYYNGDLNETLQLAIEYYFVNRFESEIDRQKVREAGRMVQGAATAHGKRRAVVEEQATEGLSHIKRVLGKNYYGPEVCETFFGEKLGKVPGIPGWITPELLKSRCPLAKTGETIGETHSLIFVPAQIGSRNLTVHTFAQMANGRAKEAWGNEVLSNTDFFDQEEFKIKAKEGTWVLVYNGEAADVNEGLYKAVSIRELLLSKGIMMISSRGEYESIPQHEVTHAAGAKTPRGFVEAKIESDGLGCSFMDLDEPGSRMVARVKA